MNYFRKALIDNDFELQEGMESTNFVYEENQLQIVVCLERQHFKVFDDGKEIKEGDIRELHIEYQSVTRKAFVYPVISALIDLELSGRNVIEGLRHDDNLKELSEAVGINTEDQYGVYDVLLTDNVTHVYVAALNHNQAMHLAIGSNFSNSESSTFIDDMSLYTCEGQELTDFISEFKGEVVVLKNVRKKDTGGTRRFIPNKSWLNVSNLKKGHIVRLTEDCGANGKQYDILQVSSLPYGRVKTLGVRNLTQDGCLDEANLSSMKIIGYVDQSKDTAPMDMAQGVHFKNPFNGEGKVFMLGHVELSNVYYVYAPSIEVAVSLCPHDSPMYKDLGILAKGLWTNYDMQVELESGASDKNIHQYIHHCIYSHDFQVLFVEIDDEDKVKGKSEADQPKYQGLFDFFSENHNLTLTETGIEDIIGAVQKEMSEVETEVPSRSDRAKEDVFMLYNSSRYQELRQSAMGAYNDREIRTYTKYIDNDVIEKMKLFIDFVEQCDHLGKK